jgi:hypothetical protein
LLERAAKKGATDVAPLVLWLVIDALELSERACALTSSIPFEVSDYLGLSAHTPE